MAKESASQRDQPDLEGRSVFLAILMLKPGMVGCLPTAL
ncbi:hypothetical protein D779_1720 [Imhoffiella purpurea]|uniref:Uncharacterized protein n=1 Tax=Imhoffiella purpurea TaxID=1249627 RepID=W9VDU6_9GAMM|nr:hypothetical protein D779_1720 [Imhoffiella purpurea]